MNESTILKFCGFYVSLQIYWLIYWIYKKKMGKILTWIIFLLKILTYALYKWFTSSWFVSFSWCLLALYALILPLKMNGPIRVLILDLLNWLIYLNFGAWQLWPSNLLDFGNFSPIACIWTLVFKNSIAICLTNWGLQI